MCGVAPFQTAKYQVKLGIGILGFCLNEMDVIASCS